MKVFITIITLLITKVTYSQDENYAITVKLRGVIEVTIDGKTKKLKKKKVKKFQLAPL